MSAKKAQQVDKKQEQELASEEQGGQVKEKVVLPTEITARAYPIAGGAVLAAITFDINGCMGVRGARLIDGKNGPFVSMPKQKTQDGYKDTVFATTKEMHDLLNRMAISAYQVAMETMQKKMDQSQAKLQTQTMQGQDAPDMNMTM